MGSRPEQTFSADRQQVEQKARRTEKEGGEKEGGEVTGTQIKEVVVKLGQKRKDHPN
jgi:hypothetical protein